MTTPVLYEIAEKLQTPRLGLPIDFTIDFVDIVATISEFVVTRGLDMGCRDDDDDWLVETAVNGRAYALVTRDKDLLDDARIVRDLKKRGCALMTVDDFAKFLMANEELDSK
jgi:putative PIN family toxin of toxin-antitoxin system